MEKIKSLKNIISREVANIIGGALFIAILSKIAMFMPFTPIPVTMQTLATLLVAAALGKKGVLSVLTYIALGLVGLPIINAGMFTAGYIVGFVIAAYIIGWAFETGLVRGVGTSFLAFCVGEVIIITCGAIWLGRFVDNAFALGFWPFIPGAVFKVFLAVYITKKIKKW